MKKILIAIVLLVVAAAAASPFLIGSQIEKTAREQVDLTNQQITAAIKSSPEIQDASLKIQSYEKGYLSSKAKALLSVAINMPGQGPQAFEIPVDTDITHGPYLGESGFGAAKLIARPDLSSLDLPEAITKDTFIIESLVSFAGDMDQKATIAPIKHTEEDTTFDFAGATITSDSNLKNRAIFQGLVDVQQLVISSADEPSQFVLKPFKMDIKGTGDAGLMKGDYEATSGVIEASVGEEVNVTLQSLSAKGKYEQAKGIDMMIGGAEGVFKEIVVVSKELSTDPIKVPELTFSSSILQPEGSDFDVSAKYTAKLDPSLTAVMQSPVDVKTADLEVQFKSLPLEAVKKYQALVNDLAQQQGEGGFEQKMQTEVLSIVQLLAKNATATHLELHATSDDGDLNANIDAGFKPGVQLSEQELMMLMAMPDPQKIMSILVGRGNIDLNKGITDKAGLTPMIQIMAADFVSLDGDIFKSELQIVDGQLLVNGSPLPFFAPPAAEAPAQEAPALDAPTEGEPTMDDPVQGEPTMENAQ